MNSALQKFKDAGQKGISRTKSLANSAKSSLNSAVGSSQSVGQTTLSNTKSVADSATKTVGSGVSGNHKATKGNAKDIVTKAGDGGRSVLLAVKQTADVFGKSAKKLAEEVGSATSKAKGVGKGWMGK